MIFSFLQILQLITFIFKGTPTMWLEFGINHLP
jgi:hypothetical protein